MSQAEVVAALQQEVEKSSPSRDDLIRLLGKIGDFASLDNASFKITQKAAEHCLDDKLKQFLTGRSLSHIAPYFVAQYCFSLNDVAKAVARGKLQKVPPDALEHLQESLELRGELLNQGISPECHWLDALCEKFSTKQRLRDVIDWQRIESLVPELNGEDTNKVLKLWSSDNEFREAVLKHGLGPSYVEKLSQQGVHNLGDLDADKTEGLIRSAEDSKTKRKLKQLFNQESIRGKKQQKDDREKLEQSKKIKDDLKALVRDIQCSEENGQSNAAQQVAKRLSALLPSENRDSLRPENVTEPVELLKKLENLVQNLDSNTEWSQERYKSDEEVVARASAGLALYGISMGNNHTTVGERAKKQLLQTPEYCPLNSPRDGTQIFESKFASAEAAESYCKNVRNLGKSLGAKLSGFYGTGLYSVNASGSTSRAEQESNTQIERQRCFINKAVVISNCVVPMASFQLSCDQMRLTSLALDEARAVSSPNTAGEFFDWYGTHVSGGTHHLGGIMWRIAEIESEEQLDASDMLSACSRELNAELSGGVGGLMWSAAANTKYCEFESTASASDSTKINRRCNVTMRLETLGPATGNFSLFQTLLSNNRTWHVIDRDDHSAMIAVWEVLKLQQDPSLETAAKILEDHWIRLAANARLPAVEHLLQRVYLRRQGLAEVNAANREVSEQSTTTLVNDLCSQNVKSLPKEELLVRVSEIAKSVAALLFKTGGQKSDLMVRLWKNTKVKEFLSQVSSPSESSKCEQIVGLLRTLFDERVVEAIQHSHLSIDDKVLKLLKTRESQSTSAHRVELYQPIEAYKLLATLRDLRNSCVHPITKCLIEEELCTSMSRVFKSVKDTDKDHRIVQGVKRVFNDFGWTKEGLPVLTSEQIESLFKMLDDAPPQHSDAQNAERNQYVVTGVIAPASMSIHKFGKLKYNEWIACRAVADATSKPREILQSCLLHRLSFDRFRSRPTEASAESNPFDEDDEDEDSTAPFSFDTVTTANQEPISGVMYYPALIDLLLEATVPTQIEILSSILSLRFAVPLIVENNHGKTSICEPLVSFAGALEFVSTSIGSQTINLVSETERLRIIIISQRAANQVLSHTLMKEVLHVTSFRSIDKAANPDANVQDVLEVGCGFIVKPESLPTACVVLHVVGNYKTFAPFLNKCGADVLIYEHSSSSMRDLPDFEMLQKKLKLRIDWEPSENDPQLQASQKYVYFVGSIQRCITIVKERLCKLSEQLTSSKSLKSERLPNLGLAAVHGKIWTEHIDLNLDPLLYFQRVNFSELRTKALKLQKNYLMQGKVYQQHHAKGNNTGIQDHTLTQFKMQEHESERLKEAPKAIGLQELQNFVSLVATEDNVFRTLLVLAFQKTLDKHLYAYMPSFYRQEDEAWQDYSVHKTDEFYRRWKSANRELQSAYVGIEHFWREIGLAYSAINGDYPKLAAKHLLDGFPLEMLDGDSVLMNTKWIREVLDEVKNLIGDKRLFVLSVIGTQSSGKSTALNVMFGTRLRTSLGMCTRGVNMVLLKAEDFAVINNVRLYDYVLLLDVEGLHAPQFADEPDSVWHDNHMATFAIMLSDAVIVIINGEDNTAAQQIIPIAMKVIYNTDLIVNASYVMPHLFFLYTRLDTTQGDKLRDIKAKLSVELNNAWQFNTNNAAENSNTATRKLQRFNDLTKSLNLNIDKDTFIAGQLKRQCVPPEDVPLDDYGRKLLELRRRVNEAMYARGNKWKPHTLSSFHRHLSIVWDSVSTNDFTLQFKTAMMFKNHEDLNSKFTKLQMELLISYRETYTNLETKIIEASIENASFTDGELEKCVESYKSSFRQQTAGPEHEKKQKLQAVLNNPLYSMWKLDTLHRWNVMVEKQRLFYERSLKQLVSRRLQYNLIYENHLKELRQEIRRKFESRGNRQLDSQTVENDFNDFYRNFLAKIKSNSPESTEDVVEGSIESVYSSNREVHSLVTSEQHFGKKIQEEFKKCVKIVTSKLLGTSKKNQEKCLEKVQVAVLHQLHSVRQYDSKVVQDVIDLVQTMTINEKGTLPAKAHQLAKQLLTKHLQEIQHNWDKENSVVARLEDDATKDDMFAMWKALAQGQNEAQLLLSQLQHHLSVARLGKQLAENLKKQVLAVSLSENWVSSVDVLYGIIDKQVFDAAENKKFDLLVRLLRKPAKTYAAAQKKLIRNKVDNLINNQSNVLKGLLTSVISSACEEAKCVSSGRAIKFLTYVKGELSNQEVLIEGLPDGDEYRAIDNDIDSDETFDKLKNKLLASIATFIDDLEKSHESRFYSALPKLCDEILEELQRSIPGDTAMQRRCASPCPLCNAPCMREEGHVLMPGEEEKKHDCVHQPKGLIGRHFIDDKTLTYYTCYSSQNLHKFKWNDQWHDYNDYSKIFTDWQQPHDNERRRVLEYVLYNCHEKLAELFDRKPCETLPLEYNHDKESILKMLRSKLGNLFDKF